MARLLWLWLPLVLVLAHPARAAEIADLPSASGGTHRVWFEAPANPWAIAILFPGGGGAIGIQTDGGFRRGGNFLVRTRAQWLANGLAVLIPDAPSALPNLYLHRNTDAYAQDIRAMLAFIRQRSQAPVWLIGTSQGTNAVASGAARLTGGEIAGVVFSASLTRSGTKPHLAENVFQNRLAAINVPALVISHEDDGCVITPPADAPRLRAALRGAPRSDVILITGGSQPRCGPCEAFSQHGFLGIENEVVDKIASWMRGR